MILTPVRYIQNSTVVPLKTDCGADGRANADRSWSECFAQLVGTVLSLWDAAALDAAGQDGEVAPSFINLADASIKMVYQSLDVAACPPS